MLLERRREPVGQFFRGGHHEAQAAEIRRRTAAQIDLQERRRRQQERHRVIFHERADGTGIERIRMKHHAHAERGGQAQRAGETEGMEKRQNAENAIAFAKAKHLLQLRDVRSDVVMGQHHALGIAGAAAGKNDRGQRVEDCRLRIAELKTARVPTGRPAGTSPSARP